LAAARNLRGDDQPCTHCQRCLEARRYTRLALQHDEILSTMTDLEYHDKASAVLAGIEARIDAWLQDDVVDIDTQRTGGLLEMGFPNGSKIILNTQPPLHEIWLAARSGGFHYKFVEGAWRDTRDGRELLEVLSACASEQAAQPLNFSA
jgi:CyaY protein